jgi:hypothetical protein
VRQLQRVEVIAGKKGKDAVEPGDLVDGEGEGDEFGRGTEGDEVEECLSHDRISCAHNNKIYVLCSEDIP